MVDLVMSPLKFPTKTSYVLYHQIFFFKKNVIYSNRFFKIKLNSYKCKFNF